MDATFGEITGTFIFSQEVKQKNISVLIGHVLIDNDKDEKIDAYMPASILKSVSLHKININSKLQVTAVKSANNIECDVVSIEFNHKVERRSVEFSQFERVMHDGKYLRTKGFIEVDTGCFVEIGIFPAELDIINITHQGVVKVDVSSTSQSIKKHFPYSFKSLSKTTVDSIPISLSKRNNQYYLFNYNGVVIEQEICDKFLSLLQQEQIILPISEERSAKYTVDIVNNKLKINLQNIVTAGDSLNLTCAGWGGFLGQDCGFFQVEKFTNYLIAIPRTEWLIHSIADICKHTSLNLTLAYDSNARTYNTFGNLLTIERINDYWVGLSDIEEGKQYECVVLFDWKDNYGTNIFDDSQQKRISKYYNSSVIISVKAGGKITPAIYIEAESIIKQDYTQLLQSTKGTVSVSFSRGGIKQEILLKNLLSIKTFDFHIGDDVSKGTHLIVNSATLHCTKHEKIISSSKNQYWRLDFVNADNPSMDISQMNDKFGNMSKKYPHKCIKEKRCLEECVKEKRCPREKPNTAIDIDWDSYNVEALLTNYGGKYVVTKLIRLRRKNQ